jgi:hypothetical protein
MLELLAYLRANYFKTYIVSGGGVDFMRPWTEKVYGIPPEQVVGSTGKLKYELRGGKPVLMKLPGVDHVDDGAGKPVGIQKFIGRRFMLIVHHTDEAREFAYDRKSAIGRLDKALDAANTRGWTVVDMKKDWQRIFPFEQ